MGGGGGGNASDNNRGGDGDGKRGIDSADTIVFLWHLFALNNILWIESLARVYSSSSVYR